MHYIVKIQQVTQRPADEHGYVREDSTDIYEQRLEFVDIVSVIRAVNKMNTPDVGNNH